MSIIDEDLSYKEIVESAHDIIIVTKPEDKDIARQKIVYVNPAFTKVTGYTREETVGKQAKLLELFTDEKKRSQVLNALQQRTPVRTTIKSKVKSGESIWLNLIIVPINDLNGNPVYFASIERDVTKEKKLLDELEKLSQTDPMTGLLNRRAFNEFVDTEINRFKRTGTHFCLLTLDLDHFKNINDTYGHSAGDQVLKAVATGLLDHERSYDYVARIGGEEFCILLSATRLPQACKFAQRMRETIADIVVEFEGAQIKTTPSIGIAEIRESESGIEDIMKRADEALYHAKSSGRNCIIIWTEDKLEKVE